MRVDDDMTRPSSSSSADVDETRSRRRSTIIKDNDDDVNKRQVARRESSPFAVDTRRALKTILPSTYLRRLMPRRAYRAACTVAAVFWFVIGVLVLRKTERATSAVKYIKAHSSSVALDTIERSAEFAQLVDTLDRDFKRPPAVFLRELGSLVSTCCTW